MLHGHHWVIQEVPELLYLGAILMTFLMVALLIGGLLIALLECSITRQFADSIRGEKRKRKNDE